MAQFPLDSANQNLAPMHGHRDTTLLTKEDIAPEETAAGGNRSATTWLAASYAWLLLTGYVFAIVPEVISKAFFPQTPRLPTSNQAALASQPSLVATEKDRS